jgi:hypothetical protein
MTRRSTAVALAVVAVGISVSAQSQAHINLLAPPPRAKGFPDTNLLRGPCGQRRDARVPGAVSTFRPGETIDVEWDVYVQHVSYFRISFDGDGDDSFSSRTTAPSDPARDDLTRLEPGSGEVILGYIEDRTASVDHVLRRVTLPNEPCDNCTLQITQFTYGLPVKDAVYYQCVDLVLAGDPVGDAGPPDPVSGGSDAGALRDEPSAREPSAQQGGNGCSLAMRSSGMPPAPWSSAAGAAAAAALFAACRTWHRRYRSS